MQIIDTVSALRAQIKMWRLQNSTIAFVPTMGHLHQGHLSLVEKAKTLADKVVVSIFVNPLQFDDASDLSAYPRTLDMDIDKLISAECNLVFTPGSDVIYPKGMKAHTNVIVPDMNNKLCGLKRPGHFDGVATIVTKLLNMVQADLAVFGEKDYQQLLLIKKLVFDLNIPVDIVSSPIYREDNGLAMSSRNIHLTNAQYEQAANLYQVLLAAKEKLQRRCYSIGDIQQQAMAELYRLGFEPDYVDIRREEDLQPAKERDTALRILLAARLGQTRLIDNIACHLA